MDKTIFSLLDRRNQAILNIIEIISDTNQWYSINELSQSLDVSSRTVQRYINTLIEFVDAYNEKSNRPIELQLEKFKGIKLIIDRGSNYMVFRNFILEQDDTLFLLSQLLIGNVPSVRKYADDNYLNEDTVRKNIRKIKHFFKDYDLGIANNTLEITGEEKQIRLIMFVIFWLVFKGLNWPFKAIDRNKVNNTINYLEDDLGTKLSEIHRRQLSYLLAIHLIRISKGHVVEMEDEWKSFVNIHSLIKRSHFLNALREDYLIYSESELTLLTLGLLSKPKFYQIEIFKTNVFDYQAKTNSDVYQITQQFMDYFEENIVEIPDNIQERFFSTAFCTHLFAKIFNNIHVDIDGHDISRIYRKDYPTLEKKLLTLIANLKESTQNPLFEEEHFLMQKYMLLFSSILPMTYFEPTITLFLDSDLPYYLKQNLVKKITGYFKFDFNLIVLENDEEEKADLILTNIPNLFEEQHRFSYDIHLFEYPFKPRDFNDIEKKLRIITQRKTN
ncbi:helix-turn-helix domain-containing protein [Vagococcus silagei]|uniref:HTH domain-containing protein n=1 Tax=Vagococcus silagei TaxID=2508885 RepID=A0A4S3B5N0_9ENTE|nr:helix-turn-helix domain-containing protein [Vagococcus silagei]THB61858.1 HTH domain-containing protein [Vagococcus silagei]